VSFPATSWSKDERPTFQGRKIKRRFLYLYHTIFAARAIRLLSYLQTSLDFFVALAYRILITLCLLHGLTCRFSSGVS
jgi:hypothetical protein